MSWDGTEAPDAAGLLEIARATLLADILPKLEGEARFKALMVANAMAIAARQGTGGIAEALARLGDPVALCAAIRAGERDDDPETAAALLALAEARCRVSAPKAV